MARAFCSSKERECILTLYGICGIIKGGILIPQLLVFFVKNLKKVGAYEKQKQGL